jgi:hypothetical protein
VSTKNSHLVIRTKPEKLYRDNPDLARARAAEDHVYLLSSTYEDLSENWMPSAVWDHCSGTVTLAKEWGTLGIAEVDLSQPTTWPSLAGF